MERTKRAENANPFKWPRYGQDQHQFSSVILTRERNFRSTWCGNSAQTRFESKPWNQDRSGEGGEELVAVRIKSSHLIKLLWAGSLFPRRIGVSCNEIPRVPRPRFRSGEREREREKVCREFSQFCLSRPVWGEVGIWILIGIEIDINVRRIVVSRGSWD